MDSELAVTCTVDGSALVGDALAVAGTQHMFRVVGSPGTSLDSHATAAGIQIVGFHNELSAVYAAVDYGFLTGIPAVVVTTSGPGCIDALAGLSCASANACPFLLLSTYGDRAESSRGKLRQQEVDHDQTADASPAKFALKLTTISEIPRLVFWAYAAAIDKGCGCYLDIPSEVLQQTLSRSEAVALVAAAAADSAGHSPQKPQAIMKAIVKAVDLIQHAERPLLVFDTAEVYSDEEAAAIQKLVQVMGIPFLNTPIGKPVVADSHPLSVSAKAVRSLVIGQCDVALVFGARLNRLPYSVETPKWRKDIKIILVNVYEKDIMLRKQHVGIVGDAKRVVELIYEEVKREPIRLPMSRVEAIPKVSNAQLQKDISVRSELAPSQADSRHRPHPKLDAWNGSQCQADLPPRPRAAETLWIFVLVLVSAVISWSIFSYGTPRPSAKLSNYSESHVSTGLLTLLIILWNMLAVLTYISSHKSLLKQLKSAVRTATRLFAQSQRGWGSSLLSKNGTGGSVNDSEGGDTDSFPVNDSEGGDTDSFPVNDLEGDTDSFPVNDSEGDTDSFPVNDSLGDTDSFPSDKGVWLTLPTDLMVNILECCPFKDTMKAYVAFGKVSSNVPYDGVKIPADTVPLLLHSGTSDETFMLYDPFNNIIFEIDRPKNIKVVKLCDFSQRMLVITTKPDGVALVDMPTGAKFVWKIATMPSDCYIIWNNGHVVKAVVGTKGSNYDTTIAILKKSNMEVNKFRTEVPFTVSPLTNPRLIGNEIFCLSNKGKLGLFNLENKVATIYEEEEEDNHDDSEEDGTDNEGSEEDGSDDVDSEEDGTDDEYSEGDEEILNDFKSSADFLCATGEEIFSTRVDEGWKSVQVKKLEQPDMKWQDVNSVGDKAIFTGTRCSIISVVPEELQNKVFLPGYYGSPPIVKAKLIESERRFFFCPTSIGELSNTSSPWFCVIGEGSDGKSSYPVALENSLWIKLNSFEAVKVKQKKS